MRTCRIAAKYCPSEDLMSKPSEDVVKSNHVAQARLALPVAAISGKVNSGSGGVS